MQMSLPVQQDRPKYAPIRNLMLYINQECNLRCTYCFLKKVPRYMTQEVALRTVDYVMQRNISGGVHQLSINFFGGEPFLSVDLMQTVIEYARRKRFNVEKTFNFSATTNGTLANARVEKAIRDGSVSLLVSLDGGAHASRHRPMVSGRESYSLVAKNLPKLAAWSPSCTVRLTYTPDDLQLLKRLQEVLALGHFGIAVCPVVEADWSGQEQAVEEAHQELGDWFLQEFAQGRRAPLEVTWQLLSAYTQRMHCQSRPKPCPVGDSLLSVDYAGNVMPCHRFLHRSQDHLGTVAADQFPPERWQYVHLRALEVPDCATCEARTVCGGGCRAVALQSGYGLQGVHPNHCLLMRAHVRQVQRIYQALHSHEQFWAYLRQGADSSSILRELATLGS